MKKVLFYEDNIVRGSENRLKTILRILKSKISDFGLVELFTKGDILDVCPTTSLPHKNRVLDFSRAKMPATFLFSSIKRVDVGNKPYLFNGDTVILYGYSVKELVQALNGIKDIINFKRETLKELDEIEKKLKKVNKNSDEERMLLYQKSSLNSKTILFNTKQEGLEKAFFNSLGVDGTSYMNSWLLRDVLEPMVILKGMELAVFKVRKKNAYAANINFKKYLKVLEESSLDLAGLISTREKLLQNSDDDIREYFGISAYQNNVYRGDLEWTQEILKSIQDFKNHPKYEEFKKDVPGICFDGMETENMSISRAIALYELTDFIPQPSFKRKGPDTKYASPYGLADLHVLADVDFAPEGGIPTYNVEGRGTLKDIRPFIAPSPHIVAAIVASGMAQGDDGSIEGGNIKLNVEDSELLLKFSMLTTNEVTLDTRMVNGDRIESEIVEIRCKPIYCAISDTKEGSIVHI